MSDKNGSKENLHKDHRQRMRLRFLKEGLENFQPHEVLELLLFYAIPQQDTNPIGHRLINRFGCISVSLDADIAYLQEVDGLGEYSATLLKLIPEISAYYQKDKNRPGQRFASIDEIARFCICRYLPETKEKLSVVMLDSSMRLLGIETLSEGATDKVNFDMWKLVELIFSHHCSDIILVHNHLNGDVTPSDIDISLTNLVSETLGRLNINLVDHIIITQDRYLPITMARGYIAAKEAHNTIL